MVFSDELVNIKKEVMAEIKPMLDRIDSIAEENTLKVLDAMRECQLAETHFNTTSGYTVCFWYSHPGNCSLWHFKAR